VKTLNWNSGRTTSGSTTVVGVRGRDGFMGRGALGHLSFRGPKQVWPIWPFVWKAWTYAPLMFSASSKIYLLLCRLWFYIGLKSSTEIKAFLTFFPQTNVIAIFTWNLQLFRVKSFSSFWSPWLTMLLFFSSFWSPWLTMLLVNVDQCLHDVIAL